jgi:hypothetical protein
MTAPQIPTPEADSTSGDKSPSFSPSARESVSKSRETTVACNGDALTAGDDNPCKTLALVSPAPAVTATVTESPEGGAEPDRLVEELRSHVPTRAPTAVSQRQAFPSFMRRYTDMAGSRGARDLSLDEA